MPSSPLNRWRNWHLERGNDIPIAGLIRGWAEIFESRSGSPASQQAFPNCRCTSPFPSSLNLLLQRSALPISQGEELNTLELVPGPSHVNQSQTWCSHHKAWTLLGEKEVLLFRVQDPTGFEKPLFFLREESWGQFLNVGGTEREKKETRFLISSQVCLTDRKGGSDHQEPISLMERNREKNSHLIPKPINQ